MVQSVRLARDPVGFLVGCRQRFGDVFSLDLLPVGRVVVIGSPALVREAIMTSSGSPFRAGAATARLLPFLGARSPLLLDDDAHRDQRRRLLHAFGAQAAAGDTTAIEAIVRRHVDRWPRGRPFAGLPAVRELAFEIVVRHLIGLEGVDLAALEQRLQRLLSGAVRAALWSPALARVLARARPRATLAQRLVELDGVLAAGTLRRESGRADVLTALAGDEGQEAASARETLDVLRALVLVGHETTGTAGAWLLQLLAEHPRAAADVREASRAGEEAVLRSCVQESLRLRPPVVDAVREVAETVQLGGFRVDRGTIVLAAPVLLHSRPDIYDEPLAFRPRRFVAQRPDPSEWIPFGGGTRRCLGSVAAVETLQALTRVVLEAGDLRLAGRPERARLSGTTIVPSDGGRVLLTQ